MSEPEGVTGAMWPELLTRRMNRTAFLTVQKQREEMCLGSQAEA